MSGTLALGVAASLVVSCASPEASGGPTPREGTSGGATTTTSSEGCPEGSRYLFGPDLAPDYTDDGLFTISELSADTAGGALIRYNANTPEAGSDGQGSPSQIVEVLADGTVQSLSEAEIEGAVVSPGDLYPLGADTQGGQYLFDRVGYRVVLRSSKGTWTTVASLPRDSVYKAPSLALGPDATVYIATASQVLRVQGDGQVEPLAGIAIAAFDILYPQPPLTGLPLPALAVDLPSPTALVVGVSGEIYMSTPDTVYVIEGGLLNVKYVIGTTLRLPDAAVGPPNITGLAVDELGRLVIGDSANELVYTATGASTMLLTAKTRFISDGVVMSRAAAAPLLTVDSTQEVACAL